MAAIGYLRARCHGALSAGSRSAAAAGSNRCRTPNTADLHAVQQVGLGFAGYGLRVKGQGQGKS